MKIHPKNTILFLAAVALIFMGVSVYLLDKNQKADLAAIESKKMQTLSPSSDTEILESEVNNTDFSEIDSEMNQMEGELEGY